MKKSLIILFILFSLFRGNAQTKVYEIYLEKTSHEKDKSLNQYRLVNPADTAYIRFVEHQDFGKTGWIDFRINDAIPDGLYKVYVNHDINKEFTIKNGLKDGKWTEYKENGERSVTKFAQGNIQNPILEYFKDGAVKRKTYTKNNMTKCRTSYTETGIIVLKEYFKNNKQYKIKRYDKKGKLKESKSI